MTATFPDFAVAQTGVTASIEMKWRNGWSASAAFEGEFSNVTSSYAGKGVARYALRVVMPAFGPFPTSEAKAVMFTVDVKADESRVAASRLPLTPIAAFWKPVIP